MPMDPATLDYHLDPAQIAQRPPAERDGGRLLVVERERGVSTHAAVRDLPQWLAPGDLVVVNDAEVMPARLHGRRASGAAIEVLLTEPADFAGGWRCLARRAGRVREGERLRFAPDLAGVWYGATDDGPLRTVRLEADGELDDVVHAIEAHHNEVEVRTVEAVLTQAADSISGGRPGARRACSSRACARVSLPTPRMRSRSD